MNKTIKRNGKTATLRMAKKEHLCTECHLTIFRDESYWGIIFNTAGLGSRKFPDRTHVGSCLELNLRRSTEVKDAYKRR